MCRPARIFDLIVFVLAGVGVYGFFQSGQVEALIFAFLMGALGAWIGSAVTLSVFQLWWDEDGLSGPSNSFFNPKRVTIAWSEVKSFKALGTQSFRVEANDGRRIHWHTAMAGYLLPLEELAKRRPDLAPARHGGGQ